MEHTVDLRQHHHVSRKYRVTRYMPSGFVLLAGLGLRFDERKYIQASMIC